MRAWCYVIYTATQDWKPIQVLQVVETYEKLLDVLEHWNNNHSTRDGMMYDTEDGGFLVEYPTPYGYSVRYVVEKRPFIKG